MSHLEGKSPAGPAELLPDQPFFDRSGAVVVF
jgi:hypothetical protein